MTDKKRIDDDALKSVTGGADDLTQSRPDADEGTAADDLGRNPGGDGPGDTRRDRSV